MDGPIGKGYYSPFSLSSGGYSSESQVMLLSIVLKGISKYCYTFYNTTQETTFSNNSDFYNKASVQSTQRPVTSP